MFNFLVPSCQHIADIAIVVDSSGSLRKQFHKEIEFVKILADVFGVESDGSRIGVVTFSYSAEHSIKLSDHSDLKGFKAAVDNLPFMGYTTRIDKALAIVRDESFLSSNGGRGRVPKIVFILTDGTQTKDKGAQNPSSIAAQIRKKYGAMIFAIGIGQGINRVELEGIANGESRVYLAKNFGELKSTEFVTNIALAYCEGILYIPIPSLFSSSYQISHEVLFGILAFCRRSIVAVA